MILIKLDDINKLRKKKTLKYKYLLIHINYARRSETNKTPNINIIKYDKNITINY